MEVINFSLSVFWMLAEPRIVIIRKGRAGVRMEHLTDNLADRDGGPAPNGA